MNKMVLGLLSVICVSFVNPLASTTAHAARAKTLRVAKSVVISAPPAEVWDKVKSYDGLHTWHPGFASDEIVKGENNKVGAVRKLTVKDGPSFEEELLAYSTRGHLIKYKIIDPSPLPITNYVSILRVRPGKHPKTSVVMWEATFKRKKVDNPSAEENDAALVKLFSGVFEGGLGNLKKISETK
jgi:mxaD protein